MDSRTILKQLEQRFPLPRPKQSWVDNMIQSLRNENLPINIDVISEQYLYADLMHSTVPSGVLPSDPARAHQVHLFPTPSLLQICSITEVGSSAFQLQTVAEQRKDIFEGASRIKRMDDEEPADDDADDKAPAYPRGMLKLEVTDGERVMRAMEYRRINELTLGETSLGAKLLVHNVKTLRNLLLLEPANTQVLGYSVEDLDQQQSRNFLNGLRSRLGKPPLPQGGEQPKRTVRAPSVPQPVPRVSAPAPPAPPPKATVSGASARAAALAAALGPPQKTAIKSPYFQQDPSGPSQPPAEFAPSRIKTQPRMSEITDTYSDFDSFDDSFLHKVDQVTARASGQMNEEDEYADMDDSLLHHIQEPMIYSSASRGKAIANKVSKRRAVIADESDDEKENRPGNGVRAMQGARSASGKSSSWAAQEDIIELSSD